MKSAHPAEMFLSRMRSAWQAVVVSGCHPGVEWWLEHSTSKYKIRMHTLFTVRFNEVCMCIKQLMTNVCIIIPNDYGAYSNKPSHNMCFFDMDSTVATHLALHHLWCEGIVEVGTESKLRWYEDGEKEKLEVVVHQSGICHLTPPPADNLDSWSGHGTWLVSYSYIKRRLNLGREGSTGKRGNQGSFPQDIS